LDYLKPELIKQYGDHFVSYLLARQKKFYAENVDLVRDSTLQYDAQATSSSEQATIASASASSQSLSEHCNCEDHAAENYNFHGRKS